MPLNIGWTGIIVLVFVALIFFGPKKLPQLGRAIGTTFKEFRAGTKEITDGEEASAPSPSGDRTKSS